MKKTIIQTDQDRKNVTWKQINYDRLIWLNQLILNQVKNFVKK